MSNFSFDELNLWINELKRKLTDNELKIANEIINEILKRIEFILDVGLSYLTLNRETKISFRRRIATYKASYSNRITTSRRSLYS